MARRAIEEERKRLLCGGSRMCRLFNGGICVSDFVASAEAKINVGRTCGDGDDNR